MSISTEHAFGTFITAKFKLWHRRTQAIASTNPRPWSSRLTFIEIWGFIATLFRASTCHGYQDNLGLPSFAGFLITHNNKTLAVSGLQTSILAIARPSPPKNPSRVFRLCLARLFTRHCSSPSWTGGLWHSTYITIAIYRVLDCVVSLSAYRSGSCISLFFTSLSHHLLCHDHVLPCDPPQAPPPEPPP